MLDAAVPHAGYDASKKIKGRKRHIVTDTLGLMLFIIIHGADIQDRDGGPEVLKSIRHRFPWLRHMFADGGSPPGLPTWAPLALASGSLGHS